MSLVIDGEVFFTEEDIAKTGTVLADENAPLADRFRAVFVLRNIGGEASIDALIGGMKTPSALLKHEIAYCIGQLEDPYALPFLSTVLENKEENSMVRHEAGEALGAIGDVAALPVLKKHRDDADNCTEVRETCELAVARIEFLAANKVQKSDKFLSVDPAPPARDFVNVAALRENLLNTNLSLFERYRAMFALRDIGSEEAVQALAEGLEDKSALFRHEIGYVFGQLQHPAAVGALMKTLKRDGEHAMVRHEAAEALGSIATDDVFAVLKSFAADKEVVVAQSCVVALDMYEHERSGNFQYADTLTK